MARVSGDFGRLRRLIDDLKKVGAGGMIEARVSQELAAASMKLIADGFRKERDPYGDAWAPLKHRNGKILRDTGRMAASANAQPRPGGGVVAQISTGYAKYHQAGAKLRRRARLQATAGNRFVSAAKAAKLKKSKKGRASLRYIRLSASEGTLPRRMMVPDPRRGLGPIWSKAYQRVARKTIRELVRKRGGGA